MLVLSRRPGEELRIGDVVVRVMHSSASRVSLGVQADESIKILRGELIERDHDDRKMEQ
jgi:carbon storage regulator CsrA